MQPGSLLPPLVAPEEMSPSGPQPVGMVGGEILFRRGDGSEFTASPDLLQVLGIPVPEVPQSGDAELLGLAGEAAGAFPQGATPEAQPAPAAAAPQAQAPAPGQQFPAITAPQFGGRRFRSIDEAAQQAMGLQAAGTVGQQAAVQGQQQALSELDDAVQQQSPLLQQQAEFEQIAHEAQARAIEGARERMTEVQSEIDAMVAAEPDTSRWFTSRPVWQRAAALVGVLFHSARSPQAGQAALGALVAEIDKDVALQERTLERQLQALQQKKATIGEVLELDIAKEQALLGARMAKVNAAARMIDLAKSRAQTQVQIAQLEQAKHSLTASLGDQMADFTSKVAAIQASREANFLAHARAQAGGGLNIETLVTNPQTGAPIPNDQGGPLMAKTKEQQIKLSEGAANWADLDSAMSEFISIARSAGPGNKLRAKFIGENQAQRLLALSTQIETSLRNMRESGVMTDQDVQRAREVLGRPSELTGAFAEEAAIKLRGDLANSFANKASAMTVGGTRGLRDWLFSQPGSGSGGVGFQEGPAASTGAPTINTGAGGERAPRGLPPLGEDERPALESPFSSAEQEFFRTGGVR